MGDIVEASRTESDLREFIVELGAEAEVEDVEGLEIESQREGLRLAKEYEAMFIQGAHQEREGMTMMAIGLYTLTHHDLWMYFKDENGRLLYPDERDYVDSLMFRGKVSRATAFSRQASMRIGVTGLGFEVDEVAQIGLTPLNAVKRNVTYDRATGEITGLRDDTRQQEIEAEGHNVVEYVRDLVRSVAPNGNEELDLPPKEVARAINQALRKEKPSITFYDEEQPLGGFRIGYLWDHPNGSRKIGWLDEPHIPQDVIDKYRSLLRIVSEEA